MMAQRGSANGTKRGTLVSATSLIAAAILAAGCGALVDATPNEDFTGTVQGTVTVDGVPQAGVSVAIFPTNGGTFIRTTTDAAGAYAFTGLVGNSWTVDIRDNVPPDVVYDPVVVTRGIDFEGEVEVVDFNGRRRLTGTFGGNILMSGGDASHDPFVFNAPTQRAGDLVITRTADDQIEISGPGLGPTTLPLTMGTIDPATGQFTTTGTGVIAGNSGIQIDIAGSITGAVGEQKNAMLTITVGGNGGLPGGQPISYTFDGGLDDASP